MTRPRTLSGLCVADLAYPVPPGRKYGTFYDATDHAGKAPRISHIAAYVQGNYNPAWSGCEEVTVTETGKDANRKAREWRLNLELTRRTAAHDAERVAAAFQVLADE